jgi:hypothetical protein
MYYAEGASLNYGFFNTLLDALDGVSESQEATFHKADLRISVVLHSFGFGGDWRRSFVFRLFLIIETPVDADLPSKTGPPIS